MSEWPPKPENEIQNTSSKLQNSSGQEWQILEKAVLASVEEQRRARRWGSFLNCSPLPISYLYWWYWVKVAVMPIPIQQRPQAHIWRWWTLLAPLQRTNKV